ncbi:MAG: hypothetical protein NTZ16_08170, partial [Verrucomicrobia bacterium]|nr:hypothetical protein [Verrucomicrobiota bacterium]
MRRAALFVRRVGVTTQMALLNKSARAAVTPVFSAPAIGWLPMNDAPVLEKIPSSAVTTGDLTLPASVMMHPGASGIIASIFAIA